MDQKIWFLKFTQRELRNEPIPTGSHFDEGVEEAYSFAFSPNDNNILASGNRDRTVRLWNVKQREALSEPLIDHSGRVYSVAFTPDGKVLASGSDDNTVRLWDVAELGSFPTRRGGKRTPFFAISIT